MLSRGHWIKCYFIHQGALKLDNPEFGCDMKMLEVRFVHTAYFDLF